jgi:hypothetical protein
MIMRKIILATLVTATVLTPIVAHAANVAPTDARSSIQNKNEAAFQRGEDRGGDGRRGDGEGRRGGEGRGPRNQAQQQQEAPQDQVQQEQRMQRNRPQDRNAGSRGQTDGQRGEYRRQGRQDAQLDGRYYDRNRDGNLDRRWDRNRDGNLDRNWDRNRDGRLDRRYDRNDDERIDRRYDRNRNGQIDRRYDRNNDNRIDRWNNGVRGDRWNNGWRSDRRYDWRGHRNQNRSYYSPGRYYSPYRGHNYNRLSIGFYLGSGYYGSRYWINDPWQYRLPTAYGPYRWVRYYDDVILIDIRNGRVVDVIHDFFW